MRIARLAGVEICVNRWLILLMAVYVWAGVGMQVILAFACVGWHEFGHCLAAYYRGFAVREIELFPFGGVARLEAGVEQRPRDEMIVALAGPLCSFFLFAILEGVRIGGGPGHEILDFLRNVNFCLGMFNLVPVLPLDGGRLLRAWLASRFGALRATFTAAAWGEGIALVFGLLAIIGLYWRQTGLDLPIIAGFLLLGVHKERRMGPMVFWGLLQGKRRQLNQRSAWRGEVVVARQDVPVSSLLPQIAPERCLVVTVVDRKGRILGQIGEGELLARLAQGKADIVIGDMVRKP
ncbi:MAG: M50 family metallopeptidase [Heliobacteriaceae bacterium]|nr:M50 family metallopeptidase [Heliobacteriaceae bacterium]MDD4586908.1 M50 family metallopeptidase [Heliobacteriaceae bacterium]